MALLAGCTDTLTVEAPYAATWSRSLEVLQANGYQLVSVPDPRLLVPASDEKSGRAWFLTGAEHSHGTRVVALVISPVEPAGPAKRTIKVTASGDDWVAMSRVDAPKLRNRTTFLLKQAFANPDAPVIPGT